MLCPDEYVHSVTEVDLVKLKQRGIRNLLIDLDNTLVPWRRLEVKPEIRDWVTKAIEQGMKLCIVSNTRNSRRLHDLASQLGIPYVRRGLKPRRIGFLVALDLLNGSRNDTAVIGDQIFTDILGGNRLNLYTILVVPLHQREFFGTKISRFFERRILRMLNRRGLLRKSKAMSGAGEQSTTLIRQMETE